jgi:AcrR family transcriptional regulator
MAPASNTREGPEPVDRATDETEPEMIWLRTEPSTPRSAHSRAEIAAAACEIADTEGFEAVSMRRVAQHLGAGTMTLYNYVRRKDELITLMADAVLGEALVPVEELTKDGWRAGLRRLAVRRHETFCRHRWILDRITVGHPLPNGLRIFEQELRACAVLDISPADKFSLVSLIADYVHGFAIREARGIEEQELDWNPEMLTFLRRSLEDEEFVEFRRFIGDDVEAGFEAVAELFLGPDRFELGLDLLLDGIEAGLS